MTIAVNHSQQIITSVCQALLETAPASGQTLLHTIKRFVSGVFAKLSSPAPGSARDLQQKLTACLNSGHLTESTKDRVAVEFFQALALRFEKVYPEGVVSLRLSEKEKEAQTMPLDWRARNAIARALLLTQGPMSQSYRKELFDRVDATFYRPLSQKVSTLGFLALNSVAMLAMSRGWSQRFFPSHVDMVNFGLMITQLFSQAPLQAHADFVPVRVFRWINSAIAALSEMQLAWNVSKGTLPIASCGMREVSMLSSLVQRFSPIPSVTTPLTLLGVQGWMFYSVYQYFTGADSSIGSGRVVGLAVNISNGSAS